mmetsp:Transcript_15781/g.48852  ORF Transcript_15781/g.48852 Transcript_15781/m.48852 type:complete len:314 (+) Transcript_15781:3469-4410(+)
MRPGGVQPHAEPARGVAVRRRRDPAAVLPHPRRAPREVQTAPDGVPVRLRRVAHGARGVRRYYWKVRLPDARRPHGLRQGVRRVPQRAVLRVSEDGRGHFGTRRQPPARARAHVLPHDLAVAHRPHARGDLVARRPGQATIRPRRLVGGNASVGQGRRGGRVLRAVVGCAREARPAEPLPEERTARALRRLEGTPSAVSLRLYAGSLERCDREVPRPLRPRGAARQSRIRTMRVRRREGTRHGPRAVRPTGHLHREDHLLPRRSATARPGRRQDSKRVGEALAGLGDENQAAPRQINPQQRGPPEEAHGPDAY